MVKIRTILLLLCASVSSLRADALTFYNNWFVTGDYAVAGVGLSATHGVGTIQMSGVPCVSGTGLTAQVVGGALPGPCAVAGAVPAYPVAAFLYWETVENTAAAAGATGTFNGHPITGSLLGSDSSSACWLPSAPSQTLRVYRADVLRFLPLAAAAPHVRLANASHSVAVGTGAGVLATEGASLVVIYRIVAPANPLIVPLRSVVIYDGAYTLSNAQPSMTQKIFGFYQASSTNPAATMTHIVGNGHAAFQASLKVNGAVPPSVSRTQPLVGAQGANWDNLTFAFALGTGASSTETKVVETGNVSDCLSWGAVVTSTNVQDSDHDGLLDIWEKNGLHRNLQVSPATFGGCSDYPSEPCVDLPAMGALNGKQDIFVQIDWMHASDHSHVPKVDALDAVAKTFANHNIALHFDVGPNYQGLGLPYIIPYTRDSFGNLLAQGGSDLDETSLVCHNSTTTKCAYNELYPVLSFKFGLASVRDGNQSLGISPHLNQNRKDIFRYALFAHALAGPFDLLGKPTTIDPTSVSGEADRPGADIMVTLGLWRSVIPGNDQTGSDLVQAGTLMHELGHNLGLSHAGWNSTPNCMPNYPSVMNYLYQTRGLTDANGIGHIDYSYGSLFGLNESSLSSTSLGPLQYRVRYYSPLGPNDPSGRRSLLHCDGTPVAPSEVPSVRQEAPDLSVPGWSNGTVPAGSIIPPEDVNFDGTTGQAFLDQPDWSSLNLQHIGGRPMFGLLSNGVLSSDAGVLSSDAGVLSSDAGVLSSDAGSLAVDQGVLSSDAGVLSSDAGVLSSDAGVLSSDAGDVDYDTIIRTSVEPPPSAQQCTGCGLKATNGIGGITLTWTPPDIGGSLTYRIYRCAGIGCAVSGAGFLGSTTSLTFTDTVNAPNDAGATCPAGQTCYNTPYTYAVTSQSTAGAESPFSTTASSEVTHLFVIADSQTVVYGNPNPAPTFQVYGKVVGTLSTALVSCAYTPATPRNAGPYPIVCTGPATTSATDGVSYNVRYTSTLPGVLTIAPRPITVTAAAAGKTYDGTTASTAVPSITAGTLAYSDTAAWTETYDNPNVGTTHIMTPGGTVSDGNGGNNYSVTFVPISTGVITPAPLAITPDGGKNKIYGQVFSAFTGTAVTLYNGDAASVTYTSSGAAATAPAGSYDIAASSYVFTQGSASNYAVTLKTAAGGLTVAQAASATAITLVTPQFPVIGQPVTVAVSVTDNSLGSVGTPTGTVTVTASSGETCTVVLSNAAGSCTLTFSTTGSKSIAAAYGGDTNFQSSSSTAVSIGVSRNGVSTAVSISQVAPIPSVSGQTVTVAVAVSPSAATGTVGVFVNGTLACTAPLSNGTGSCKVNGLTTGNYTFVGTYSGDSKYAGGSSALLKFTVFQSASSTVLTSAPNPSLSGQNVTFAVTVTPSGQGSGMPTGTVKVIAIDGTCTITLSNGSGSCQIPLTTAGNLSVTAAYSGDANFTGSVSSQLVQKVQ